MEKLVAIIQRVLETNEKPFPQNISAASLLRNDLGFDSLDLAELTVIIEEEYGVDIFEDGFVETVGDVLKKIS